MTEYKPGKYVVEISACDCVLLEREGGMPLEAHQVLHPYGEPKSDKDMGTLKETK